MGMGIGTSKPLFDMLLLEAELQQASRASAFCHHDRLLSLRHRPSRTEQLHGAAASTSFARLSGFRLSGFTCAFYAVDPRDSVRLNTNSRFCYLLFLEVL